MRHECFSGPIAASHLTNTRGIFAHHLLINSGPPWKACLYWLRDALYTMYNWMHWIDGEKIKEIEGNQITDKSHVQRTIHVKNQDRYRIHHDLLYTGVPLFLRYSSYLEGHMVHWNRLVFPTPPALLACTHTMQNDKVILLPTALCPIFLLMGIYAKWSCKLWLYLSNHEFQEHWTL